jgi:hypothetical protein
MIGAIEASESPFTAMQDDDLQCPSISTPKLPLGLSLLGVIGLLALASGLNDPTNALENLEFGTKNLIELRNYI